MGEGTPQLSQDTPALRMGSLNVMFKVPQKVLLKSNEGTNGLVQTCDVAPLCHTRRENDVEMTHMSQSNEL